MIQISYNKKGEQNTCYSMMGSFVFDASAICESLAWL